MRWGRLHRYNTLSGQPSEAMLLEREFADWQGAKFCLAVASGGQAMQIALRASGVRPGDQVLTNRFTLAPVPGSITAVGGKPVLVEITPDLVIDLDDLAAKARSSGARHLLLSHMRGHLCDMDQLSQLADDLRLTVIENCAHTRGARWYGKASGAFGLAGCFSTQTYKHMNSGEGGLLNSDDADFMARATMLSGSYMLYDRHGAGPDAGNNDTIRLKTPNTSARLDNLRAALLRPQLRDIGQNIAVWNQRHDLVAHRLATYPSVRMAKRPKAEQYVGSSLHFCLPGIAPAKAAGLVERLADVGVELKWFGAVHPAGLTSNHHSWRYVTAQSLPRTEAILAGLFDLRLPLTFDLDDCAALADHILDAIAAMDTQVPA
ncbi:DegT/DnrJ/EryC1/StrS family aminotransferase [Tabrizicola sp.]|uniref:DegT/DnrJ/EryC1/StrS family aminotransferase n=1 Tax=Tabrizicola sp. TaxID=2005166 RepID=UPI00286B5052|nr:DegT/DnrJ/EryC1/StrS family aminotransferase [Tabrizicola sp.]